MSGLRRSLRVMESTMASVFPSIFSSLAPTCTLPMPGMGGIQVGAKEEKHLAKTEAIVLSMTKKERRNPEILNGSRRLRIAKGSGTQVSDVNALIKQFSQMREMMRMMKGGKGKELMRRMGQMGGGRGGMPGGGFPGGGFPGMR